VNNLDKNPTRLLFGPANASAPAPAEAAKPAPAAATEKKKP
jgi:phospholipid/cholesterol/gamma-HCH transport system substrate-binding protein